MPLSTTSCYQCLLVTLWRVNQWPSPYVYSTSSWSAASSSAVSTWFEIRLSIFLVWIPPLPSLFLPEGLSVLLILTFVYWTFFTIHFFCRFIFFALGLTTVLLLLMLFHRVDRVFKAMEFLTNIFGLLKICFLIRSWSLCLPEVFSRSIFIYAPSVDAVANLLVENFCRHCVIRLSASCLV